MTRVALVTEGANEDAVPERPKSNLMRRWPAVPLETASQAQGVPDSQPLVDNQRTVLVPFQTPVSPGRRSSTCRRPPPLVSLKEGCPISTLVILLTSPCSQSNPFNLFKRFSFGTLFRVKLIIMLTVTISITVNKNNVIHSHTHKQLYMLSELFL